MARESVREGRRRLSVDYVPHRLGEEHATHVAAPTREVVSIEPIDGDLGGHVLGRGHRTWAHNLMEGMRLVERTKGAKEVCT